MSALTSPNAMSVAIRKYSITEREAEIRLIQIRGWVFKARQIMGEENIRLQVETLQHEMEYFSGSMLYLVSRCLLDDKSEAEIVDLLMPLLTNKV